MPDLLAGTTVKAADTPPTVSDSETGSFDFTHTTYAITGEPATVGVAFLAPTTGRVLLHYSCGIRNTSTSTTLMAPVIREGSTVGSGTTFLAANDDNAVAHLPSSGGAAGTYPGHRTQLVTGLTPEATYNVRLEHRVTGSTGSLSRRIVVVEPAT